MLLERKKRGLVVSEWNYTKCAKPFESIEQARAFMVDRGFAGQILRRDHGGYTAVCPTYPEGYYPDAVSVETITEGDLSVAVSQDHLADEASGGDECCSPGPVSVSIGSQP